MEDVSQEELDNAHRESKLLKKTEVLKTVNSHFEDAIKKLKNRSAYDQTIIGNLLTTIELELKKDIKQLTEHQL
jgi:hypothetical protein